MVQFTNSRVCCLSPFNNINVTSQLRCFWTFGGLNYSVTLPFCSVIQPLCILSHTPQSARICILPPSDGDPVDPSGAASLRQGAAPRRRPGAGLVRLALSYQPQRLCTHTPAAVAACSDGKHRLFSLWVLKIDPSRAPLPPGLLEKSLIPQTHGESTSVRLAWD